MAARCYATLPPTVTVRWSPRTRKTRKRSHQLPQTRPRRPVRQKRKVHPGPKPRPESMRVKRRLQAGGANKVFRTYLWGKTLRYTRANPTPKASGTLASLKGTPGAVKLASNLDGVFLALVRSTTRTVPGRFAAKPRRSSRKAISCMAHDTPLVGCDGNSSSAASARHPLSSMSYARCTASRQRLGLFYNAGMVMRRIPKQQSWTQNRASWLHASTSTIV